MEQMLCGAKWKAGLIYMQLYGLKILIQDTIGQFSEGVGGTNAVWHWYYLDLISVHNSVVVFNKYLLSVWTRPVFHIYVPLEDVMLLFKGRGSSNMH